MNLKQVKIYEYKSEQKSAKRKIDAKWRMYERQKKQNEEDPSQMTLGMPTKLIVAKQRNGPIGDVELVFLPSFTRFETAEKEM